MSFPRFRRYLFFFGAASFFTDFSPEVFSLPNLPLFPFTSIPASSSGPRQAVISVLGAKVIPGLYGNARSGLLFSAEISSPVRVVFPRKTLHFLIPTFLRHPKRKRPTRQKDALKKMSDKREADKKVRNSTPSALESALKNKKSKASRI